MLKTIDWLLEGEPWIRYRTRLDLLMATGDDPLVQYDYEALISDPKIQQLIEELQKWPGKPIKKHNDADLLLHKLSFLADTGIKTDHKPVREILEKVMRNKSEEGPFEVVLNMPAHFGGAGNEGLSWILCDAPSILYAMVRMGMENNRNVQEALKFLVRKVRNNGWGCTASKALGENFLGPGKKEDPCPYANLLMLKVLAQTETWKFSAACHNGTEVLLDQWENSYTKDPYMFKMGSDFRKLKAPLIWFDLLHVTDVLSQFDWVRNDHRFHDMINVLTTKADYNLLFRPESVWAAWEDWDFGQTKNPSRWLTLLVLRILKRIENYN